MKLESILNTIKGKTIAVVYIFEKEEAKGYDHFYIWKNELLTKWINAIYEIECIPYLLDLRTFIFKASNNTLPHIDYVLNLNNGCVELSTMSLVPSLCGFLSIPCIPCNSLTMLSCENKNIANCIVRSSKINVPSNLERSKEEGIYRPKSLGNSLGVRIGKELDGDGVYQEFIFGYDITIPFLYNIDQLRIEAMPSTLYLPNSLNPKWIYDEKAKIDDKGFKTVLFEIQNKELLDELIKLVNIFEVNTFARIDARIKTNKKELSDNILSYDFSLDDFYFIEINSMPTIETDDGFDLAFKNIYDFKNNKFFQYIRKYCNAVVNPTVHGFVLLSSIASFITSKC